MAILVIFRLNTSSQNHFRVVAQLLQNLCVFKNEITNKPIIIKMVKLVQV
jgi:hypothetical protein